jgi:hypothetical protein
MARETTALEDSAYEAEFLAIKRAEPLPTWIDFSRDKKSGSPSPRLENGHKNNAAHDSEEWKAFHEDGRYWGMQGLGRNWLRHCPPS